MGRGAACDRDPAGWAEAVGEQVALGEELQVALSQAAAIVDLELGDRWVVGGARRVKGRQAKAMKGLGWRGKGTQAARPDGSVQPVSTGAWGMAWPAQPRKTPLWGLCHRWLKKVLPFRRHQVDFIRF